MKMANSYTPDLANNSSVVDLVVEESLVADDRAGLSPSEMVERKLARLLKSNPLPVSQLSVGRRLIKSR
jgi:hypothetical protein